MTVSLVALAGALPRRACAAATDDPPDLRDLKRKLRDERPEERRRGVKGLARLGTRDAWRLIFEALEDLEPEVADEAQWQIAELRDSRLLRELCGRAGLRSSDNWVTRRVAEALGRFHVPIDAEPLLRALARTEPERSVLALWSIERLARNQLLTGDASKLRRKLLAEVRGARAPEVCATAFCALSACAPEAAREILSDLYGDRRPELRVAALEFAFELEGDTSLPPARVAAADPEPAVRTRALDALLNVGTRDALRAIVDRLELEDRPRIRQRALGHLQAASGMRYRSDPRPWRLWLSKLPDDWRAGQHAALPPSLDRTVAFADLPILSDRLCFLVDFSGSLWNEREGGGTRKDVVDQRMREVLPALREGTLFNLMPYTGEPLPWKDSLVPNRNKHVHAALRWFERCNIRGRGNVYDAAILALRDPEVDTLVVFTDGAPTGGRHWKLDLMMPLLIQRQRFRPVAFDSIVVDAPPRLSKHWAALAAATGGLSIELDL